MPLDRELANTERIIGSGLLPLEDDVLALSALRESMIDVYRLGQMFRTRTEMEASVLNEVDHPTPDSKYWQAIREQGVMFDELMALSFEYRKTRVILAKAEHGLAAEGGDSFERQLLEIEADRLRWILRNQERVAHHRIRELREWEDIKGDLELYFSREDVNEHQLISYAYAWINQVAVGALDTGSLSERVNLSAKLGSILDLCRKKGCLSAVLRNVPGDVLQRLNTKTVGPKATQDAIAAHIANKKATLDERLAQEARQG